MWTVSRGINTPKGVYVPQSDNLSKELVEAAKFAGINAFNVKIDGMYYDEPGKLPTNSIAALTQDVSVESVEIKARDIAGC
jgi:hypothetical protein